MASQCCHSCGALLEPTISVSVKFTHEQANYLALWGGPEPDQWVCKQLIILMAVSEDGLPTWKSTSQGTVRRVFDIPVYVAALVQNKLPPKASVSDAICCIVESYVGKVPKL